MPLLVLVGCSRSGTQGSAPVEPESAEAPDAPVTNAASDDALAAHPPAALPPGTSSPAIARPPKTIYRSELERALGGGPGYLLYQLAPEPYRLSGKFVGWEITRLFPDDPGLCAPGCDLEVGDVILSVNGERLETPQAFSDFLTKLPKARALEVRSLRNERRRVVKYAIVEQDAG